MVQEPISRIEVKSGTLYFRGHSVTGLAMDRSFEDVLYLLVYGHLPKPREKNLLCQTLKCKRTSNLSSFRGYTLVEFVEGLQGDRGNDYESLLGLVATFPVAVAHKYRISQEKEPVHQRSGLSHAANLLWMLTGVEHSALDIRNFETCLILHMDDPDNPSLRKLLQTLDRGKSAIDAITAAIRVHGGPLHHGAGSLAAKMIYDLAKVDDLRAAMTERLERGERLYGLGHRIYRSLDPRAKVLREMLCSRTEGTDMSWLPSHVDTVAKVGAEILLERKGLTVHPNVDLYNALVYGTFGLQTEINTNLFAVSRIAGWTAHVLETFGFQ
jgi:citrate synthase